MVGALAAMLDHEMALEWKPQAEDDGDLLPKGTMEPPHQLVSATFTLGLYFLNKQKHLEFTFFSLNSFIYPFHLIISSLSKAMMDGFPPGS